MSTIDYLMKLKYEILDIFFESYADLYTMYHTKALKNLKSNHTLIRGVPMDQASGHYQLTIFGLDRKEIAIAKSGVFKGLPKILTGFVFEENQISKKEFEIVQAYFENKFLKKYESTL